ncbi:GNAT family N-acetyltransferase [Dorea acetigenes]|jgi:ribosomal protein S18 acetylase RimI-like enzyme|uniref:GNAT family N-acetyltransferase n=1 Tax=Dorea acetigenes TaxID=2981787 RepID=A0ABT2RLP6_9FIRM|nr:GNAT family N-acetyltransferase [Dorea acetigenes]MCU6686321.1 GNAT family N-acetyltransferase [Dorea acetigenes]SCI88576.1 TDP-fucosamine acetyltransferase [uncultured Clostridium sp.]
MVRKAISSDVEWIEAMYNEHFAYENEHGAFTVFKKGIYPTKKDAEDALCAGALYVYEEEGSIAGSIIVDKVQPTEYRTVTWGKSLTDDKVMVIHLLMVRPCMAGKGIASSLVKYAMELAKRNSCEAIRLDTGSQNIPAVSLYKKLGFRIVSDAPMKVGGAIPHSGHLFLEKILSDSSYML